MKLLKDIRDCTHCKKYLPLGPRPVVSFSKKSRIMVIGQAPGTRVHETGVPWNDPSGDRLREWLKIDREQFYNTDNFAIVPMGFCYPGKGKSGDLPPRPECAELWMEKVLRALPNIELTLLIGQYSQSYFLEDKLKLTDRVKNFKEYLPNYFVLPHPSPRNNIWMKKHPWFTQKNLPSLQRRVKSLL